MVSKDEGKDRKKIRKEISSEFLDISQFICKNLHSINNLLRYNILFCFMALKDGEHDRMSTAKFGLYDNIP